MVAGLNRVCNNENEMKCWMLGKCWENFGKMLEKCWKNVGKSVELGRYELHNRDVHLHLETSVENEIHYLLYLRALANEL